MNQAVERREPLWFYVMWVGFSCLMAFFQASAIERAGFAWWRVIGIFFFGLSAGLWFAQTGPLRRLMAWRARKFASVPRSLR